MASALHEVNAKSTKKTASAVARPAAHQPRRSDAYVESFAKGLSVIRCFFLSGWGSVTLLVPYTFPDHWHYVMPLALVYILTILRHSAISLRFFVQNVVLQEEGVRLAENFRRAKEQAEQALYDKNLFLTTASHDQVASSSAV